MTKTKDVHGLEHNQNICMLQVLHTDSSRTVVSQGNDGTNDQLDTDLLDLQLCWILSRVVAGIHDRCSKLCARFREIYLERQV